jgi:sarcosine oxidase
MRTTSDRYEVAVVGQGVIGLSAALALARRGRSVIALDALGAGHPLTSSTGASRSFRAAYAVASYVRLALGAIDAWRALEAETGRTVLHQTGQVDLGPAELLAEYEAVMREQGVDTQRLDAAGLERRFPELRLRSSEWALYHPNAGTVLASKAMAALVAAAGASGVELASPERVEDVELLGGSARLTTPRRRIDASSIVVAAGPWSGELLARLGVELPLSPGVAQVTYLGVPALVDRPGLNDLQVEESGRGVYGHPVPGIGYKVAFDAAGREPWSAEAEAWPPDPAEQEQLLDWVRRRFPHTATPVIESQRHPWTMTPDTDFVIDAEGPLVVACGCSGHAFKFGPALGELVADAALGVPGPDAAMFSMRRPAMSLAPVAASTPIDR